MLVSFVDLQGSFYYLVDGTKHSFQRFLVDSQKFAVGERDDAQRSGEGGEEGVLSEDVSFLKLLHNFVVAALFAFEGDEFASFDDEERAVGSALAQDVLVEVDGDFPHHILHLEAFLLLQFPERLYLEQSCLHYLPLAQVAFVHQTVVALAL